MCGNVFVLCQPHWPGQTPIPHHNFDTWNPFLDVTSGMVKDPADVLDRQKCLDALAALRHAKWFQVRNIILLSYCSLMRYIICWIIYLFFAHLVFFFVHLEENLYYFKQHVYTQTHTYICIYVIGIINLFSRMPPIISRIWLRSVSCIHCKSNLIWISGKTIL